MLRLFTAFAVVSLALGPFDDAAQAAPPRLCPDLNGDGVSNVLDVYRLLHGHLRARGTPESPEAVGGEIVELLAPSSIEPGQNFSALLVLSSNTTPLFGYSMAVRAFPEAGWTGVIAADIAGTSFFLPQNLIAASGAQMDPTFTVIVPWQPSGVFLSTNTDDGSTVLAVPGVNDVLGELHFDVADDAAGYFSFELGPASVLADGNGMAVPFTFVSPILYVCVPHDYNCDRFIDVNDLLALVGGWGPCLPLLPDLNSDGAVDVNDLLILIGQWGTDGSADFNDDGTVDVNDLLFLIGQWGEEEPFCADLNDDGIVDVNDLLLLIGGWGAV